MRRAFVRQGFAKQPMVAAEFPMVGGKNDPGVLQRVVFLQVRTKPADLIIDLGHQRIICLSGRTTTPD